LRPPRRRDAAPWVRARVHAQDWLEPWEASAPDLAATPWRDRQTVSAYLALRRAARKGARAGTGLPFVITNSGSFAGMASVADISRGPAHSGALGYWIDRRHAGRGVASTAVALLVDHCFGPVGLHRIEAWVRPENEPSLRLLARIGFREEGVARASLWVDGAWRDHVLLALCAEEAGTGAVHRIRRERRSVG
jgi:ribosomal-protein-alanine N-acetyltransferase